MPGQNKNLPNPVHRGDEEMEMAYNLIDKACERIAENLSN